MPDLYWPAGVEDSPLRDSISWSPRDIGRHFQTESGDTMSAIRVSDAGVDVTASYVMTEWQFAVWETWWRTKTKGGILPFWLRDPIKQLPHRFRLQPGQAYQVNRQSPREVVVTLPLLRLPA